MEHYMTYIFFFFPSSAFCTESTACRDHMMMSSHDPIGGSDCPISRPDTGAGINTLNHIFVSAANTAKLLTVVEAIQLLPIVQLGSSTPIKLCYCQNGAVYGEIHKICHQANCNGTLHDMCQTFPDCWKRCSVTSLRNSIWNQHTNQTHTVL
jgi:hypothetical protein